jgi:peptide/nickel transport system substrate-binding protein
MGFRTTFCIILLTTVTSICATAQPSEPVRGGDVTIHSLSDPENLNPLTATDAGATEIDGLIYESLTTTDWETLETIPVLAASLPVLSRDGMSYDISIRRDAKFSDGHPVTADDFIFYLKALKNPYITNAAPTRGYYARVDAAMRIDGDPYRLRVYMTEPYYLGDQWIGGLMAMPKHIWDPNGMTDRMSFPELNRMDPNRNQVIKRFADWFQEARKGRSREFLIGSGPYMFEEWRRNEQVALVRNENYWWKNDPKYGRQYPDRIIWRTMNDANAAAAALQSGAIDCMPIMEKGLFYSVLPSFDSLGLIPAVYDYPAYTYIGYNQSNPIFKDKLVRQAFAYAIDRDTIIESIYHGLAVPVQSPIDPRRPEYDSTLPIIRYDLDRAAKLLTEAGWSDSDGDGIIDKKIKGVTTPFRFTIMLNSGNKRRESIARIFAQSLRKIGIAASASTIDWALFLNRTRDGQYDAFIGGWATGVVEGDMYQIWHSKSAEHGGSNYVKFKNKRVDKLIEQIRGEFDFEKRKTLYREIQQIIYDEQPYNFLVAEKQSGAYSNRLNNVQFFGPRPCYNPAWWWVTKGK